MKANYLFSLIYIVISGLSMLSCSNNDSGASNAHIFIRFTLEGTDYDFGNIISAESNSLTLNGNNGEGLSDVGDTQISLFMPPRPVVGTYEFERVFQEDHKLSLTPEPLGIDFEFAESGTITITEVEGENVSGTFNGTIVSEDNGMTFTIANGSFRRFTF